MVNDAVRVGVLTLAVLFSFFVGAYGATKNMFSEMVPPALKDKEPDFAVDVGRPSILGKEFSLLFLTGNGRGAVLSINTEKGYGEAVALPYNTLLEDWPLYRWADEVLKDPAKASSIKDSMSNLLKVNIDRYVIMERDDLIGVPQELLSQTTMEQLLMLREIYESALTDLSITETVGIAALSEKLSLKDITLYELKGSEELRDGEVVFMIQH